ncbi:hypothetical protein [Zunongwangia endophytica]|uniref:Uncharacterized protein n=1 Tax=Zunongwangia endophytica TaxID=1808945 RepID=A0ABV8HEN6_9FLAO|nr:hypothetical protein [Zunongwangia endophytica]MDN3594659.1 hypothetical protein [Zunongwangia endophytica]
MRKLEVSLSEAQYSHFCRSIDDTVKKSMDNIISGNLNIVLRIDTLNITRAKLILKNHKVINCGWVDYQVSPKADRFQELEVFKNFNKTEAFFKLLEIDFIKEAFLNCLGFTDSQKFEVNLHSGKCITFNDSSNLLFIMVEEPNDLMKRELRETFYLFDHFKTELVLIDRNFKIETINHKNFSSKKIFERCIQNQVPQNNLFLEYFNILFQK